MTQKNQTTTSSASKTSQTNSNCRTGCKTQDHATYGECLKASNIAIDKTSLKVK